MKFGNDETFKQWNVEVEQNMFELKGMKLYEPEILNEKGASAKFSDFINRKVKHLQPLRCGDNEWVFVYGSKNYDLANNCVKAFKDAQSSLGMSFNGEPIYIEVPDKRELK